MERSELIDLSPTLTSVPIDGLFVKDVGFDFNAKSIERGLIKCFALRVSQPAQQQEHNSSLWSCNIM
jgi:hypothetical protein